MVFFHAGPVQRPDGLGTARLDLVRDEDVPGVPAVNGHMDHGADAAAVHILHPEAAHQLGVAGGHGPAVHLGDDPLAALLGDVPHPVAVQFGAVGPLEALGDRMGGGALRQGGQLKQLGLVHGAVVDPRHLKDALGQGAGLVKDHIPGLGEGLEVVGALDQHTLLRGAADAGEEGQRDRDHQRTGAADDKEGERPVHPGAPVRRDAEDKLAHQRRQHRQRQRRIAHRRGIHPGKPGDKGLGAALAGGGVLHQVEDLGDGGFTELPGGADVQQAGQVDAAGDDLVPFAHLPGHALPGEGGGIQRREAPLDDAVDRHLLPGLYHDEGAHLHLVRVHLFQPAVHLDVGVVRADVLYVYLFVAAALADGVGLNHSPIW